MQNSLNQLYSNLKPGERIDKLLVEYLSPFLEPIGFNYLKSKRAFFKKNEFFDFHISWIGRKFNEGNRIVKFDIFLSCHSPKYRNWETEFYELEKNYNNAIDGDRVDFVNRGVKE
jgi:hypothetical protein